VIRLQTALGEQLFDIAERERVPKIPAHGTKNQLRRRLPPLEDCRSGYVLHDLFRLPTPAKVAIHPAFGPAYGRRIRAMGICDRPTAPRSPWQNGHVERLIGSIRRESLDHLIVFGKAHLHYVLKAYASYYNEVRTHLSLDGDAPDFRRMQKIGRIAAIPILGGLHHQYVRV
jgi:transposase InsO family protein